MTPSTCEWPGTQCDRPAAGFFSDADRSRPVLWWWLCSHHSTGRLGKAVEQNGVMLMAVLENLHTGRAVLA
jgi:hypothetical protein